MVGSQPVVRGWTTTVEDSPGLLPPTAAACKNSGQQRRQPARLTAAVIKVKSAERPPAARHAPPSFIAGQSSLSKNRAARPMMEDKS